MCDTTCMPNHLGEILRREREASGLSRRQLARMAGYHESVVRGWERGTRIPADAMPFLAKALGVTLDRLFGVAPPLQTVPPRKNAKRMAA